MSPLPRSLLLLVLSLGLTACGFHLAGLRPLPAPLQSVYIDSVTPYRVSEPPLEASLRARLQRRGGSVTGDLNQAQTIIRLTDLKERREVLSVGLDGKAIEYQLTTTVRFEVISGGKVLVPPAVLSASQDYSFQPQQVLAKEAEEARLRQYIQRQLAELIMLRLDAQLSRNGEVPATVVEPEAGTPPPGDSEIGPEAEAPAPSSAPEGFPQSEPTAPAAPNDGP